VPLSEEQSRLGLDVTVFFVAKDNEDPVQPCSDLVSSKCFSMTLPFRNPGMSLPFAKEVRRKIKEFDFIHIHAIWNFPTYFTMCAAFWAGVPYMVAPQGSLDPWALRQNNWGKWIYGALTETPLLQRATYMQAVSAKEAQQIKTYGLSPPTIVVPNGVSLRPFDRPAQPLTRRLGIPPDRKTILYLSRLNPKKGAEILIAAFARIPAEAKVTLVIAGGDSGSGYETRLRQFVKDLGLESRCVFLGEVRGVEKYQALLGADLFVLPSHSEGLPVAVLEAMAAKLPVIITPDCNLPEVEDWNAGCIVAAEANALATAMTRLILQPERAREMGKNARRLIDSKFTWERIARQTFEIYREVSTRAMA
jgi:glycosyltransferase involved in cell wall biosynthesis